jgi:cell filamentation protein
MLPSHKIYLCDFHRTVNLTKEGFHFPAARFLEETRQTFEDNILKPNTPCSGTEEEVLRKTATAHLELLFVHPYRVGNGRTARLVATLIALQAGYNGFNWEIAEERFADYNKALQTGDQKGNLIIYQTEDGRV